MDGPYPEDCISFSQDFVQPQPRALFTRLNTYHLRAYSSATGLVPGELEQLMQTPSGTMTLQPSMWTAIDLGDVSFMPPENVLRSIVATYEYNFKRDYHQRRRLDEVSLLPSLVYTAHACSSRKSLPIFTKNPRTGVVTTHLPPYTDLPTFSVASAEPSLMAVKAITYVRRIHSRTTHPLIIRLFELADYIDPVFAPPPRQLPSRDTTPPVAKTPPRKRKAVDNSAQQTKRQKVGPRLRSPATRAQRARNTSAAVPSLKIQCPPAIPVRTYYRRDAKDAAIAAMATPTIRSRKAGR